jgi:hypothetical protein
VPATNQRQPTLGSAAFQSSRGFPRNAIDIHDYRRIGNESHSFDPFGAPSVNYHAYEHSDHSGVPVARPAYDKDDHRGRPAVASQPISSTTPLSLSDRSSVRAPPSIPSGGLQQIYDLPPHLLQLDSAGRRLSESDTGHGHGSKTGVQYTERPIVAVGHQFGHGQFDRQAIPEENRVFPERIAAGE